MTRSVKILLNRLGEDTTKGSHRKNRQFREPPPRPFSRRDRTNTTILTCGFPQLTHTFLQAVGESLRLNVEILPTPDHYSLDAGKEFGNRGQCNPTYYTVGNLIRHLQKLQNKEKLTSQQIADKYVFVTMSGCGPCRMGMYVTEYRKALRDSGFPGFRVILLGRQGEVDLRCGDGLAFSLKEILQLVRAVCLADIVNQFGYKTRPYEIHKGSTDQALKRCSELLYHSLVKKRTLSFTILKCRKILRLIQLHTELKKPKVLVQGEFWAKTTEGEGNYHLYRFLEEEGAEVCPETLIDWALHQMFRARWESRQRKGLVEAGTDQKSSGVNNYYLQTGKRILVEMLIRCIFIWYARLLGLRDYRLSNHDVLAKKIAPLMSIHVDGGEDHMEIAHRIHAIETRCCDVVISVKPFSCLSSSGVSDGIQAKVTEMYPESLFTSVETNGDAPANFYSRIQMQLYKAKNRLTDNSLH